MNILMLNYEFPPLGGGSGVACEHLLREYAKDRSLRVDLVTSSIDKAARSELYPNVTVHYIDIGKKSRNLHYQSEKDLLTYSFKAYFYCRRLLKEHKYDLIHAFFSVPCGFLAMMLKLPYILSLRGSDVPFHNPRFFLLDKLFFQHLCKVIWNKASFVVANSETLIESAGAIFPRLEYGLIYNGVDTETYVPDYASKESGRINLLYAGRLSEVKGTGYLIRAFGIVKERFPTANIKLWVVGGGNLKAKAREMAERLGFKDEIAFLGRLDHGEVRKLYSKCDIFVLPSLNEGMPMVLLEAMASGLAVICTDMPSMRLLVENGRNGWIVEKKDPEAIASAIAKYISAGKEVIMEHGMRCRQKALKMSWHDTAMRYAQYYNKMIK